MKQKIVKYIGNLFFAAGVLTGIYALADIYFIKSSLPSGVCPITNNKPLMFISAALCVISLILSFLEPKASQ